MKPRIIVADDHVMVAQGLSRLLSEAGELVAVVSDGRQLVEATREHRPEIIVSDLTMPVLSGLDAMRQIKADGFTARFVFLTIHTDARLAAQALRAGASGYLLKQAAGEELVGDAGVQPGVEVEDPQFVVEEPRDGDARRQQDEERDVEGS